MRLRYIDQTAEQDAISFNFAPLTPLLWTAGQSIRLEVPGVYGPEERRFTISSAPSEQKITITTRVSDSPYKQALQTLSAGTEVDAYDIRGDFTWGDAVMPRVFMASGIGVTPFRAIFAERVHLGQPLPVTLLHASKAPLFGGEFAAWQTAHPEFSFHYIDNQRLTAALAKQRISDLPQSLIYLSGPSAMVDEIAAELTNSCSVPETQLKKDWFTGRLTRDD